MILNETIDIKPFCSNIEDKKPEYELIIFTNEFVELINNLDNKWKKGLNPLKKFFTERKLI